MRIIILSLIFICTCTVLTAQVTRNSKYDDPLYDQSIKKDTGNYSKNVLELSGGVGFPERLGFKLKYGGTFQIGASVGWVPGGFIWLTDLPSGEATSVAIDLYFHFIRSKKNNLFKWYLNGGLSKFFPETSNDETIHYIIYTKLGRSFNFKNNTGINLDIGLMWINLSGTTYYSPLYTASHGHPMVNDSFTHFYPCPSLDLSFFVKL
jgi:hypothetical protein